MQDKRCRTKDAGQKMQDKRLGRSRSAYRLRPTSNGQARGEGERMAVRPLQAPSQMFVPHAFLLSQLENFRRAMAA